MTAGAITGANEMNFKAPVGFGKEQGWPGFN